MTASGSRSRLYLSEISRTILRASSILSFPSAPVGSTPNTTFSATVNTGTSMKCWWTMPIPAAIASAGEVNTCDLPSMRMSPSSGLYIPYSTLISVDFPAPFSPMSESTSPVFRARLTLSFATTPGKRLVIPRNSSFMNEDSPWITD